MRLCQLYRHFDREGKLLYVGISFHAFNRLMGHKQAKWFEQISRVEIENFPDRRSAELAEIKAIREERPIHNISNVPIEEMTKEDAVAMGLSLKRFEIRKAAAERRNQPPEQIDWAAAKKRLEEILPKRRAW